MIYNSKYGRNIGILFRQPILIYVSHFILYGYMHLPCLPGDFCSFLNNMHHPS